MAIVTVAVLGGAAVVSSLCVALVDHQRRRLAAASGRLARFNAASGAPSPGGSR